MKRVRYSVAMSLDGYIAGPSGEFDWIIMDPEIDFDAIYAQFDTVLMGRKTFEPMVAAEQPLPPGMPTFVFSTTLQQQDFAEVTIVSERAEETVAELRDESGADIWLFGGGELFRRLLHARLVDTVEVAIIPVLLGDGISVLPGSAARTQLELIGHRTYGSGIVGLDYAIVR